MTEKRHFPHPHYMCVCITENSLYKHIFCQNSIYVQDLLCDMWIEAISFCCQYKIIPPSLFIQCIDLN